MSIFSFLLGDQFGDGWNTAKLFVYPSDGGVPIMYSLKCGEAIVQKKYCFNPDTQNDGDYIVVGITGYKPTEDWEVIISILT